MYEFLTIPYLGAKIETLYNVLHVSGVHHQRRNSVAHEVEKGGEKLRVSVEDMKNAEDGQDDIVQDLRLSDLE